MGEARSRSIAKSISWRVVATATTALLVYLFTGELLLAASIGSFEFLAKLVLYYVHERTWQALPWGTGVSGGLSPAEADTTEGGVRGGSVGVS